MSDLSRDGAGWLRLAGDVVAAPVPKGYRQTQQRVLDVLGQDDAWRTWWSASGFDHLLLYLGWYTHETQQVAPLSSRFRRRGDHVEAALTVVFDRRDKELLSLEQAEQRARADVSAFFELASRRLGLPAPPELPRRVFVSKRRERRERSEDREPPPVQPI